MQGSGGSDEARRRGSRSEGEVELLIFFPLAVFFNRNAN